ncbi:MAG TPA: hypothetical protein PLQ97_01275 [Myxococcota bacterium]|nr:hypothetical protein [Myxococcota bacterium]HQK49805.1 hypothetical protein [Myxococcota bacterium]
MKTRICWVLAPWLACSVIATTAQAAISGFQFNGLSGVGDNCSLADRIGKSSGSTSHIINIADCQSYQSCSVKLMWSLTRSPLSGTTWAVKMSKPGGACTETDMTSLGGQCMDTLVVDEKDLSSSTNITFTFALSDLMGESCTDGRDLVTKVYIQIKEAGVVTSEVIPFQVDLKAPAAPTLEEPVEGDRNVKVKWTDSANEGETNLRYRVYWSKERFDEATKGVANREALVTGRSLAVTGLENGVEYWFAVAAVDENDNEGPLSAVTSAMPVELVDFWEGYRGGTEQGGDAGGYCFIATAAYGAYDADQVMRLRVFRDRFLVPHPLGHWIVQAYYRVSPPVARQVADHAVLRAVVRALLAPAVGFASWADGLGPGREFLVPVSLGIGALLLAGMAVLVVLLPLRWRRRS